MGSISRGLGCTHIALTLANYLCSKLGMKTAYIELNTTNQISALSHKTDKLSFRYKGIVFFPNTPVTALADILQKDYRYFILDIGVLNMYTTTDFLRCDKSFLVCSPSKWRASEFEEKSQKLFQNQQQNCIQLIMNLQEKESNLTIFSKHTKALCFPYLSNPFQLEPMHFRAVSLFLKNL